jgi:hypothetical protein
MRILTGTAGWADTSLIRSGWYPPGTRTAADRLRYYAGRFPLVEADAPYYALPRATTVAGWIDAAPDGFTMDVKAYSLLTGHGTRAATLPADLRSHVRDPWLTAATAPVGLVAELWRRFHQTFEPLQNSGLLGLVLLQFPPNCRADSAGRRWSRQRCGTANRCRRLWSSGINPLFRAQNPAIPRKAALSTTPCTAPQSARAACETPSPRASRWSSPLLNSNSLTAIPSAASRS